MLSDCSLHDIKISKVTCILVYTIVLLSCLIKAQQGETGVAVSCPEGFWGVNCTGLCHCLNGPEQCESMEGTCLDYICDRGWTGAPYCQIECKEGTFGVDCQEECHCPADDLCNKINGVCSGGHCHQDWYGPGCQIRLPKLTTPPVLENITCESFHLKWNSWSEADDIGDPPIASYTIQQCLNLSSWQDLADISFSPSESIMSTIFTDVNPYSFYEFRIRVNRLDYGKPVAGIPSPKSTPPVRPLEECIAPPGPVTDLTIQLDGSDGALITWIPPSSNIVDLSVYNISYQIIGIGDCNDTYQEPPIMIQVAPPTSRVTLTNLIPWRKYVFSVTASNVGGAGQEMREIFFSREIVPPGQVSNVGEQELYSTAVTLVWDTIPCINRGGVLSFYDIFLHNNEEEVVFFTTVPTTQVVLTDLLPYTVYKIKIRYVNTVGAGPLSDTYIFQTKQDVPTVPRDVRITEASRDTITVSWSTPEPTNGMIIQYRVIYWPAGADNQETSLTIDSQDGTSKRITDLSSFTSYHIQVQGRTQASIGGGWGNRSLVITFVTADGEPSEPTNLRRMSRNVTCLTITWDPPLTPNGIIVKYKISYIVVAIQSISDADPETVNDEVSGNTTLYRACGLIAAAQYRFQVRAGTRQSFGAAALLDTWTEVGLPDLPPVPVVRETNWTSITIRIQPVILTRGPVSGYFIVLEEIDEDPDSVFPGRRKRALPDPVGTIPLPGVTAAFLDRDEVRVARTFVVGDGQTYGDYFNNRLTANALYNIYFVVASSLDGSTKMSFSQIQAPVRTIITTTAPSTTSTSTSTTTPAPTPTPTPTPQPTTPTSTTAKTTTMETTPPKRTTTLSYQTTEAGGSDGDNDTLILIIAIVVPIAVLLIVLIIVLVILCLRKKKKKEKGKLDDSWLNYYTTHFTETKGNWSDTTEFNQPRRVTINDKNSYMPDDLKVSDIHHDQPKISFEDEYKHLPQGHKFQCDTAKKPENAPNNRFEHLLAYDHSRVVLRHPNYSDYINANYVSGYDSRSRNAYIAAQSPFTDETIADFWFMVYQEQCTQIVFMANLEEDGVVKSEQYWPDEGEYQYGLIRVKLLSSDFFANFIVRTFDLMFSGGSEFRRVSQYHFTSWPEHGVPEDPIPFLEFRMKVRTSPHADSGAPVLVHCGTGVSRTAVFIAVDSLLDQAKVENCVNVFKFCNKMRKARTMMVRTLKQYKFIYDALLEALLTNYNIVGDDLKVNYRLLSKVNPRTDKSLFKEQFEVLEEFTPGLPQKRCLAAITEQNLMKNRFKSIVPPDDQRPVLLTPGGLGRTDYINALYVDSYTLEGAFIVTQTPLHSTVIDFWKLVYDYEINCIVMLNNSDFKEDTCASYIPIDKNMTQKFDPFFVRCDDLVRTDHITVRSLKLSNAQKPSDQKRVVRQFQFESWKMYEKTPWSREGFIKLIEMVNDWLDESEAGNAPVLVHCMDGASQSGLFCACSVICEKMLLEGEVDIFHTIKHMKRRRKHFVNSLDQYKFCFKLLWDYMNTRIGGHMLPGEINMGFDPSNDTLA